jgi:hypothetical protein
LPFYGRDWRQEHERSFPLDYLPPYSPDPEPQSRCRPLCVNPRAVRIKGGPLSISSTYNSLTLCEDFVRIVLVGHHDQKNDKVSPMADPLYEMDDVIKHRLPLHYRFFFTAWFFFSQDDASAM